MPLMRPVAMNATWAERKFALQGLGLIRTVGSLHEDPVFSIHSLQK